MLCRRGKTMCKPIALAMVISVWAVVSTAAQNVVADRFPNALGAHVVIAFT